METTKKEPAKPFQITGEWKHMASNLKIKYPELTEEDLAFATGKEDDLINRIKNRLHKKADEVLHILKKTQRMDTTGPSL
jgi:hypothetical protein